MSLAEGLTASGVAPELWVQHSDRLARGDGIVARHMVELALWALKAGIKVRCVQDDQTFDDLLFALLAGRASHHESARKGRTVAAGLKRAAERGEHHGVKVDGYRIAVDVDNGRVTKRLEFDPERRELFKLIFAMALTGSTGAEIVRALNAAGHLTKPWRKRHSPAPFTRSRVSRILRNPRYAGLSTHRGQLSGSGLWPAYISPAEHEVIQSRRKPVPGAGVARLPRQAYLLCTVAVCGVCGSKMTSLNGTPRRQDGLRSRRYLCRSHQEPGGCAAPPLDAAVADLAVARSLRWLLAGGGELGGEGGAIPCSGGGRDLDGVGRAPRLLRDSDTSALMRAVSDAARSGDVPAAERGLEALVTHSYARGQRAAGLRAASVIDRNGGVDFPLADFDAWIAADLTGTHVARPEVDGRLALILRQHFTDFSLRHASDGIEITVSRRPVPERLPDGRFASASGPACRPKVLRAHHGIWESSRRTAGYHRRVHTWWSDTEILDAISAWTIAHRAPPNTRDWAVAADSHPTAAVVTARFATWGAAIRASLVVPARP
jgi:hypothetical protein